MREGWKEVLLGDLLRKIIGGGTPSKSKPEYWYGKILWCSVKDMQDDKFAIFDTADRISDLGLKNSSSNLILKGTVITSTRMGLGRAFIAERDMAINQDLKALIPNDKVDNKFLLWLIVFNRNNLENLGTGSTVKGIRLETLKSIKINLPPLKTQRNIASILSAYDDLIENNLKRIKLLEEQAQQTYEEWFVRIKFPGYETADFDEVSGLPVGWEENTLEYLCKKITDGTHDSPKQKEGGYKLVTGKHIGDGFVNFETAYLISEEDHFSIRKRSGLDKGDILFSNIGTLGNIGVVTEDFEYSCKNVIIFKKKDFFQNYLYCYLTNANTKNKLDNQSSGVAQKFYSLTFIRNYKDDFPYEELVKEFDEIVSPLFKLKYTLHHQNQHLKEARDILLPRLMSGMIDPSASSGQVVASLDVAEEELKTNLS